MTNDGDSLTMTAVSGGVAKVELDPNIHVLGTGIKGFVHCLFCVNYSEQ